MGATFLMEGFAGVGPAEGMRYCIVLACDQITNFGLEFGHRSEAGPTQAFSVEDAAEDLELVEPRTVFGKVDEADPVVSIRE